MKIDRKQQSIETSHHIIEILRTARRAKDISQSDICAKTGLTQGHLSRVERGEADLPLSSLVELAGILDFEIMPVPRECVHAVRALLRRGGESSTRHRERPSFAVDELATKAVGRN